MGRWEWEEVGGGGDGRGGMRQSMGSDQEGDFLSRFKRSLQAG